MKREILQKIYLITLVIMLAGIISSCELDKPTRPEIPTPAPVETNYILSLTVDPLWIPADGRSKATLTAKLTNKSGFPLQGENIYFSATHGTLSEKIMVTDATGEAKVTFTAGIRPGSALLTASFGATQKKVTITLTGSGIELFVWCDPEWLIADGTSTANVYVHVISGGAGIPGLPVKISTERGVLFNSDCETEVITNTDGIGYASLTASYLPKGVEWATSVIQATLNVKDNEGNTLTFYAVDEIAFGNIKIEFWAENFKPKPGTSTNLYIEAFGLGDPNFPVRDLDFELSAVKGTVYPTSIRTGEDGKAKAYYKAASTSDADFITATARKSAVQKCTGNSNLDWKRTIDVDVSGVENYKVDVFFSDTELPSDGSSATVIVLVRRLNNEPIKDVYVQFKLEGAGQLDPSDCPPGCWPGPIPGVDCPNGGDIRCTYDCTDIAGYASETIEAPDTGQSGSAILWITVVYGDYPYRNFWIINYVPPE